MRVLIDAVKHTLEVVSDAGRTFAARNAEVQFLEAPHLAAAGSLIQAAGSPNSYEVSHAMHAARLSSCKCRDRCIEWMRKSFGHSPLRLGFW